MPTPIRWQNAPDHTTPLTADALNGWSDAIAADSAAQSTAAAASAAAAAASAAAAAANVTDVTVAPTITQPLTKAALVAAYALRTNLDVRAFGALGDGTTDDTAAIQAAINAASPGQGITFPATGSGAFFKITDTLTITTPSLRLIGQPRDAYSVSIRCAVASKTMLLVKAPGFVIQDLGIYGDTASTNGAGATVTGVESWGDLDGNCDAEFRGATFQGLAVGLRTRGRNNTVDAGCLVMNCLKGVIIDGIDATFHTGPNATQNRGNTVRSARFHNIGNASTDAAIEITAASKVLHATIKDNFFDSNGLGRHVVATGTAADPVKGLTMSGNKHCEAQANVYDLTYVSNGKITDFDIYGYTLGAFGHGIVLANCANLRIGSFTMLQIGKSGIVATSCSGIRINDGTISNVGIDPATVGDVLNFNSTNTGIRIDNVDADTADGFFFTGNAAASTMTDCNWVSTAGNIDSTTVLNYARLGYNTRVDAKRGRIEDVGFAHYDFVAATARTIATVSAGTTFGSLYLIIEFTARDSVSGDCYIFAQRVIRPENGVHVITAIGTDATANATLTITGSGALGVTVAITTATATFGGVRIRAADGGAASSTGSRQVSVSMTASP
jgi:hypothetical protein